MNEFENSFVGLKNIIFERKLYKKYPYLFSGLFLITLNIIFYFFKDCITQLNYFDILRIYVSTFLPAFITFCGFTMTAYSLVVGFLNYGVFKSTIEKWYRMKINEKNNSGKNPTNSLPTFSIYQNGIALFALAILILLFSVIFFLIIKFVIELNVEISWIYIEQFNAFLLLLAILFSNYSTLLIFYNVVNIFTFSQSLNELVYHEELQKQSSENKNKKTED